MDMEILFVLWYRPTVPQGSGQAWFPDQYRIISKECQLDLVVLFISKYSLTMPQGK